MSSTAMASGDYYNYPNSSGTGQTFYVGDYFPYNPYPYMAGYTCPRCGQWVAYATSHSCWFYPMATQTIIYRDDSRLTEVLDRLERVLEGLEKVLKKKG